MLQAAALVILHRSAAHVCLRADALTFCEPTGLDFATVHSLIRQVRPVGLAQCLACYIVSMGHHSSMLFCHASCVCCGVGG
jgi:hypothetical protein